MFPRALRRSIQEGGAHSHRLGRRSRPSRERPSARAICPNEGTKACRRKNNSRDRGLWNTPESFLRQAPFLPKRHERRDLVIRAAEPSKELLSLRPRRILKAGGYFLLEKQWPKFPKYYSTTPSHSSFPGGSVSLASADRGYKEKAPGDSATRDSYRTLLFQARASLLQNEIFSARTLPEIALVVVPWSRRSATPAYHWRTTMYKEPEAFPVCRRQFRSSRVAVGRHEGIRRRKKRRKAVEEVILCTAFPSSPGLSF